MKYFDIEKVKVNDVIVNNITSFDSYNESFDSVNCYLVEDVIENKLLNRNKIIKSYILLNLISNEKIELFEYEIFDKKDDGENSEWLFFNNESNYLINKIYSTSELNLKRDSKCYYLYNNLKEVINESRKNAKTISNDKLEKLLLDKKYFYQCIDDYKEKQFNINLVENMIMDKNEQINDANNKINQLIFEITKIHSEFYKDLNSNFNKNNIDQKYISNILSKNNNYRFLIDLKKFDTTPFSELSLKSQIEHMMTGTNNKSDSLNYYNKEIELVDNKIKDLKNDKTFENNEILFNKILLNEFSLLSEKFEKYHNYLIFVNYASNELSINFKIEDFLNEK